MELVTVTNTRIPDDVTTKVEGQKIWKDSEETQDQD